MAAKRFIAMALGVGLTMSLSALADDAATDTPANEAVVLAGDDSAPPPDFRPGPDDQRPEPREGARFGRRGEGRRFEKGERGRGPRDGSRLEGEIMNAVHDVVGDIGPEREAQLKERIREVLKDAVRRHMREDGREGRGFGRGARRGEVPGAGPSDGRRGGQEVFRGAPQDQPPPPDQGNDRGPRGRGERGEGRRFERFFDRFDENGDGVVSREEFTGRPQRFDRLDLNGDGEIDRGEMEEAARQAEDGQRDRPRRGAREDRPPPPEDAPRL